MSRIEHSYIADEITKISELTLTPEDFEWGDANRIFVEFKDQLKGEKI